jgi:hypothetical protein
VAVERLASDSIISSGHLGIVPFVTYAPYFFLGYYLEKKHFEWLQHPAIRTVAAVIVSAWVLVGVFSPNLVETFKIGRATWTDQLGYTVERLMLTACLVAVLPRRELTFKVGFGRNRSVREFNITRLGRYTIYPYVFHCIFIRFLDYYHESVDWVFTTLLNVCPAISGAASGATENFSVYVLKAYGDWWRAAWTIVVSLLLLFLLTSSVCRRLGKYIVEPTWLIRRDKEGVQDV